MKIQNIEHFGPTRVHELKNNEIEMMDTVPTLTGNLGGVNAIIMFYAPWCPHCTNFIPEYNRTANLLNDNDCNGIACAMDCTLDENKNTTQQIGIQGFPTLKVFRNGRLSNVK